MSVKGFFCNILLLGVLVSGCELADKKEQNTTVGLFSHCEKTHLQSLDPARFIYLNIDRIVLNLINWRCLTIGRH